MQIIAARALSGTADVASHQSAAVLHGLSLLSPDLSRVHERTGVGRGGRVEASRHLHSGTLDPAEVTTVDGVAVTTLERTATDVACGAAGFAQALAVLDSALRLGADADLMCAMLAGRRSGVGLARHALDHASGLSENAGESWGRAQMIVAGIPIPTLQREFFDAHGVFIARCDYAWDELLVGEFDGLVKYRRHLRPGETPFGAMAREKQREDALRRLGLMVIRWVWDDLVHQRVVPMVLEWLRRLGIAAA